MARVKNTSHPRFVFKKTSHAIKTPRKEVQTIPVAPRKEVPRKRVIGVKRKFRHRSGTVALREIRKYQKTTELLIQKLPFSRLVRDVLEYVTCVKNGRRSVEKIASEAFLILQEASEQFLVNLFEDANLSAIHAKRKTIEKRDIVLAQKVYWNGKGIDLDPNVKSKP